jgi:hypothetical protein
MTTGMMIGVMMTTITTMATTITMTMTTTTTPPPPTTAPAPTLSVELQKFQLRRLNFACVPRIV